MDPKADGSAAGRRLSSGGTRREMRTSSESPAPPHGAASSSHPPAPPAPPLLSSHTPAPPPGHSLQIVPPGMQFWPGNLSFSQGNSSPSSWCSLQGGYVDLLQQPYSYPPPLPPAQQGENSHFVGIINQNICGTPFPPYYNGTKFPEVPKNKQGASRKDRVTVAIDDEDDAVEATKKVKKRYWNHDEEVRLASAFLNTSKDPIHGNDKKSDTFWNQIATEFNRTAKNNRKRDGNKLKCHWNRLKSTISDFNGCWTTACQIHKSGYSEDQLMDEAQKLYIQHHGKPFGLVHWWRTLKDEPKWRTIVENTGKEKDKSVKIDIPDDADQPRPIGREAAKAQRKGKRKQEELMDGVVLLVENINKIVEVQKERKVERDKVAETQLEISRINLKAAKEQKEARLLEVYNSLLNQDTSQMSEQAKASREKTLQRMEQKLFENEDET